MLPAAAAASPAGTLDRSVDGDGKRLLTDPYVASKVLVQKDRKILVVGSGNGQANDFVVVRLNRDGSRDAAWGDDGKAIVDFGGLEHGNAAALQRDGKLVVAGRSDSQDGSNAMAVARFDKRGELDPTFDPGGPDGDGKKLLAGPPGASQYDAAAVLVQRDGRIVLTGQGYGDNYDIAVTRLTSSGAVDGTEWDRGAFDGQALAFGGALTPGGKVVVAGTLHPESGPSEIALARFGGDGKLDTSFGGAGKVTFASGGSEEVTGVAVQPDGRIVVVGTTTAARPRLVVTRFGRDGEPDASWDHDGRAFAGFAGGSLGGAIALQPDGKVVAVGLSVDGLDMAAARFTPTGALDRSFGADGRRTIVGGFVEVAQTVALQRNGRVVLAGQSSAGAPVVRLLGEPRPPARASFAGSRSSIRVGRERRFRFSFHARAGLKGASDFTSVRADRTLARKAFTVPAGGRVALMLRLSKGSFRTLKRKRKVRTRVTVTLRNAAGLTSTARETIVLKAPRRRHR